MAVISFSMLGHYVMQFIGAIQQEGKYTIQPGDSINVEQNINDAHGIYVVVFTEFVGGPASLTINDDRDMVIVDRHIEPPIIIESFNAEAPGLYNLTVLNPTDQILEVAIDFGDQTHVLGGKIFSSATPLLVLISVIVVGTVVAIAGIIITILDRSKIKKMKQFGDTSDLR